MLVDKCLANSAQQDERQGAGIHFLVMQHVSGQFRAGAGDPERGDFAAQSGPVDGRGDARGIIQRDVIAPRGIARCQNHAHGHSFTMQQLFGKACFRFQCVAKGMAKVEQGPGARRFAFVLGHDAGLGFHALCHGVFQRRRIARRGRALPILDAEAFLDLPRASERGRLVVLRAADMSVALPVQRIRGIRSLAARPAEPGLRFALGLVDLEEGAAQVLDVPALLRAAAARGRR